jgi:hypothetical protein
VAAFSLVRHRKVEKIPTRSDLHFSTALVYTSALREWKVLTSKLNIVAMEWCPLSIVFCVGRLRTTEHIIFPFLCLRLCVDRYDEFRVPSAKFQFFIYLLIYRDGFGGFLEHGRGSDNGAEPSGLFLARHRYPAIHFEPVSLSNKPTRFPLLSNLQHVVQLLQ